MSLTDPAPGGPVFFEAPGHRGHGRMPPPGPPAPRPPRRAPRWLGAITVLLVLAMVGGGAWWWSANSRTAPATVAGVLDGGTIEIYQDGTTRAVRLAGLVVPTGEECLAAEAAAHLSVVLPVGTEVAVEAADDLASAAVHAGDLPVGAEVARAGYAALTGAAGADEQLAAARNDARGERTGIYDDAVECGPLAQVTAYQLSVKDSVDPPEIEARGPWAETLRALAAEGDALGAMLEGDTARWPLVAFTAEDLAAMREAVAAARKAATDTLAAHEAAEDARAAELRRRAEAEAERARREQEVRAAHEREVARQEEERRREDEARAGRAEADRVAAAAQPGYRESNPVAEEIAARFGLSVRYVSTTSCGVAGEVLDDRYLVAGCYRTGDDSFELTTSALWERADDGVVRHVAYHEAMHWLTWKTCGRTSFADGRHENVADAMTSVHGGIEPTGEGGYGYTDADVEVARQVLAGTCPP